MTLRQRRRHHHRAWNIEWQLVMVVSNLHLDSAQMALFLANLTSFLMPHLCCNMLPLPLRHCFEHKSFRCCLVPQQ
jgi:hypothetical protein